MEKYSRIALLGGIIDYAGTFPPAALSLEETLKSAASFRRRARHPWLMGKLAMNLADILKLDARTLFSAGADGDPWIFAALGTPVKETGAEALLRAVEWDVREIRRFNDRGADGALKLVVTSYETRLAPDVLAGGAGAVYESLAPIVDRLAREERHTLDPFFEVPWDGDWSRNLSAASEALSRAQERVDGRIALGLKVRTGGQYVPTSQQLAQVVLTCAASGLRFKATQGLHHAVTRPGAYGFVNLFACLAFAFALGVDDFSAAEAGALLDERDGKNFVFGDDRFRWKDRELDGKTIEAARRRHAATFGSCSVDEPDEALSTELPD